MLQLNLLEKIKILFILSLVLFLSVSCSISSKSNTENKKFSEIKTELKDRDGKNIGIVQIISMKDKVKFIFNVKNLAKGFHDMHVHSKGLCIPAADKKHNFESAGMHLELPNNETTNLSSGQLPPIYVNTDGTGNLEFTIDSFTFKDLQQPSGSAIVIHEKPGNFGSDSHNHKMNNKPDSEINYRVACGVIYEAH